MEAHETVIESSHQTSDGCSSESDFPEIESSSFSYGNSSKMSIDLNDFSFPQQMASMVSQDQLDPSIMANYQNMVHPNEV